MYAGTVKLTQDTEHVLVRIDVVRPNIVTYTVTDPEGGITTRSSTIRIGENMYWKLATHALFQYLADIRKLGWDGYCECVAHGKSIEDHSWVDRALKYEGMVAVELLSAA